MKLLCSISVFCLLVGNLTFSYGGTTDAHKLRFEKMFVGKTEQRV